MDGNYLPTRLKDLYPFYLVRGVNREVGAAGGVGGDERTSMASEDWSPAEHDEVGEGGGVCVR